MKQNRFIILGDILNYYSYFIYGSLEGIVLNNHLVRLVPLFNQPLGKVKEQIEWFRPHYILCHMIFSNQEHGMRNIHAMLKELKRKWEIKVIYHAGDARTKPRYPEDISKFVDLVLLNSRMIKHYEKIWKVKCVHWPYMALYQKEIMEYNEKYKSDLSFTGELDASKHHGPRKEFIEKLKKVIKVKTYPTPETGNTRFQTSELSISAKGVLGFQMGLDVHGYQDVRCFQYIGAGALYFHDKCDAIEQFFEDGVHYVGFKRDDINNFYEKYKYYVIDHPEEGQKIRQQGFEFCQKYHNSIVRIQSILDYFEKNEYNLHYLKEI